MLILAEYDENGLVNANMSYAAEDAAEISCAINLGSGQVKAFLWDADSLKPLCGAFEVN